MVGGVDEQRVKSGACGFSLAVHWWQVNIDNFTSGLSFLVLQCLLLPGLVFWKAKMDLQA